MVASPNTRLYVARCQRERGKLVDAYREFERTEREAQELAREDPRYEKAAEAAREERAELEPKLGFVEVTVENAEPGTTLRVGGDLVERASWRGPLPVMPGTTAVVVESQGREPVTQSVQIAAGEKKPLTIDAAGPAATPAEPGAEEAAPRPGALRPWAYVAGGVAVAGLATFAVAGLMANGTYSDLEAACGSGPCPPGHQDDIDAGRTQQTIANVGLGVGVLGAAAAVTFWVLSTPKKSEPAAAARSPRLLAGPGFVGVKGVF